MAQRYSAVDRGQWRRAISGGHMSGAKTPYVWEGTPSPFYA